MGEVKEVKPVLYFCSLIFGEYGAYEASLERLSQELGRIEDMSEEMPFEHTDYYREEMGKGLRRRFVLFSELRSREDLPRIKIFTNQLERELSVAGKRRVNIDPGYLTLENVILATTKNYTHRIYIGSGIYADLTLIFKKGSYAELEWTYPDYRSPKIVQIFNGWRKILKERLRRGG